MLFFQTLRLSRWKNFVKKKKVSLEVSLSETLEVIKRFLLPVKDAIEAGVSFDAKWDSKEQQWGNVQCQQKELDEQNLR